MELLRLILRFQWKFYTGVLAILISVTDLLLSDLGKLSSVALVSGGVVLGIVLIVPDVVSLVRRDVDIQRLAPPEDYVSPTELSGGTGEVVVQSNKPTQRAIVWNEVDREITNSLADCLLVSKSRSVIPGIEKNRPLILRERLAGKSAFDGKVVSQISDLSAKALTSGQSIDLAMSRYFDLLCTNYMTNWAVVPSVGSPVLGWKLAQDPDSGELRELEGSTLSNAIGASTLAVTADGFLVLIGQSNRSISSPSMWAPGGSGSVDPEDVSLLSNGPAKLVHVIAHAMERELQEEAHLNASDIEMTYVNGYFRWVNMGGKPEYSGITLLRRSSVDLKARYRRLVERPWVRIIVSDVAFDIDLLLSGGDPLACLPGKYRQTASFPLFMTLRALRAHLERDKNLLARLRRCKEN